MRLLFLPFSARYIALTLALAGTVMLATVAYQNADLIGYLTLPLSVFGFLTLVGVRDFFQKKHAILR
ncbi:MAG: FMN-binding glutamate synthase family protein, partial [Rhodomicrobium sp.]